MSGERETSSVTTELHDFGVRREQFIPAHAGLAWHAGRDHSNRGPGRFLIPVGSDDFRAIAADGTRLRDIERFALRHAFDDIDQHDVVGILLRQPLRRRSADIACSHHGDFRSPHTPSAHLSKAPGCSRPPPEAATNVRS